MLSDSLFTAQGKPGSDPKVVLCGTLAPMATGPGWWYDLIHTGTKGSVHVQYFAGDVETWDKWPTIRKANPLTAKSPTFRKKLLEERDAARIDSRLKARFLSYRLNLPSGDESTMLLNVDDWERSIAREPGNDDGRPFVGVDLGGGRAWSAAVGIWPSGLVRAMAVAPGIPDIAEQERRDMVASGTYQKLVDNGQLRVAHDLRVQPPKQLTDAILDEWGKPARVVCDRFRLAELQDAARGIRFEPRVTRWSEASDDIRAIRKMAKDGPLSIDPDSRLLLTASLAVAAVKNDEAGSFRLVKRASNNVARDDVAAGLTLAAGLWDRQRKRKGGNGVYLGLAG